MNDTENDFGYRPALEVSRMVRRTLMSVETAAASDTNLATIGALNVAEELLQHTADLCARFPAIHPKVAQLSVALLKPQRQRTAPAKPNGKVPRYVKTAAERLAVSKRMKAYWRKRRAKTAAAKA
jgi:hypothetical protein